MSENAYQTNKVSVLLAGAGHELVYYQMQPPLLSDARFIVSGHAAQWQVLETNLNDLQPELLIVQTDIAPDPEAMKRLLQHISAWNGVAVVVLPLGQKDLRGATKVNMVRGVFIAPVNWTEIIQAGYGAAMTARAKCLKQRPCSKASPVPCGWIRRLHHRHQTDRGALACGRDGLFDHCGEPGV